MSDIEIGSWKYAYDIDWVVRVFDVNSAVVSYCWVDKTDSIERTSYWSKGTFRDNFYFIGTDKALIDDTPKAVQILSEAIEVMAERGKSYDKTGNNAERSMPKVVAMFNALTGHELTPAQGWKFMACLKLARSEQGEHREDNYLDGAAYFALAGEEAGECDK